MKLSVVVGEIKTLLNKRLQRSKIQRHLVVPVHDLQNADEWGWPKIGQPKNTLQGN